MTEQERIDWLHGLTAGDIVTRWLGGKLPMDLTVSAIEGELILCGAWQFSRVTGGEVDEYVGWDGKHTGSYITPAVEGGATAYILRKQKEMEQRVKDNIERTLKYRNNDN